MHDHDLNVNISNPGCYATAMQLSVAPIINLVKDKFIVKLNTGKNREVRRVFNSINCKVISLKRIGYGNIELDSLASQCFEFIETSRLSEYL